MTFIVSVRNGNNETEHFHYNSQPTLLIKLVTLSANKDFTILSITGIDDNGVVTKKTVSYERLTNQFLVYTIGEMKDIDKDGNEIKPEPPITTPSESAISTLLEIPETSFPQARNRDRL